MKILFSILIFLIVLFIYIHIYFHIKTSNDLEIYSIEMPTKEKLEEICDLKQPIYFSYENMELKQVFDFEVLKENYGMFDVMITNNKKEDMMELPLLFNEALQLMKTEKSSDYLIMNNGDFLDETSLKKIIRHNDLYFRPPFVANCVYDIRLGRNNTTRLEYELFSRNYFYCVKGKCRFKLIPPKFTKYLDKKTDFEKMKYWSPIDVWHTQDKYQINIMKSKILEIELNEGTILYIPPYWWYSIQYEDETAILNTFQYSTYMSEVSILPQYVISFLQKSNIKQKIFNTYNEPNEEKQKEQKQQKLELPKIMIDNPILDTNGILNTDLHTN